MRSFPLEIVTPDGLEFSGNAESILLRTTEGDVELLASHADFLAALGIGRARIIIDGQSKLASLAGGFVLVKSGKVQVVATTFEFADDIDLARAEAAKARAEEQIRAAKDTRDHKLAEARLKRALNRINVKTAK
ncbi:MAG: ATP synthase F1 subunit epsilon [Clostridia bacterium]|nr:ATP synthase F1 subunit epsilon [Clostridia bacterium]